MYETYRILKIKEKAGSQTASLEMEKRRESRVKLPLQGLGGEVMYLVPTDEISARLTSIQELYACVTDAHKASDVILLDAYHSATIEGARTTVENVRKALDKPKTKDDRMVVNTVRALNYAYEHEIDMGDMRGLWEIIVDGVCENAGLAGTEYRDGMVYIGGASGIVHVPAKPEAIKPLISDLGDFMRGSQLDVWLKAAVMHFYFVYVHPYCDGNGRMIRVLTQSYLYHSGLDKMRYVALSRAINNDLSGYYTSLRDSEYVYANGRSWMDVTPFVCYFLGAVERALLTSLQEDVPISDKQKLLLAKMRKNGKNAEITIANAAGILGTCQQTAAKQLNGLVESGHLTKTRRGRKNVYILR